MNWKKAENKNMIRKVHWNKTQSFSSKTDRMNKIVIHKSP